ncbi:MAG: hypothetical protein K1Y36_12080 [Blastocatellia bacterium]|nr:hypothetical protein [Blastocatellia bacterium]
MTESHNHPDQPLDWATAEDAFHIFNTLLMHVQASSNLIAQMASIIGPVETKNLTETPAWADYLTARRAMEHMKPVLDKFSATMVELAKNQPDRPDAEEES